VDLRAGLDDLEKRTFLTLPGLELRPLGRPARRSPSSSWCCHLKSVYTEFDIEITLPALYDIVKHAAFFHEAILLFTQNYWVFGLLPSSCVVGSRNTTFRKLDLLPSSGEGGGRRHLLSWVP
jgi:hypothetical protein